MRLLEKFILGVPRLLLKKIPYAGVLAAFFWNWLPVLSGILLAVALLGLLSLAWQNRAWEDKIRCEFHSGAARPYIDHPHAAPAFLIRNLALLFAGSGVLGWLLNGRNGISGLQWFFLFAGFTLLYKDTELLGAAVTYIITDQGVGIRFAPGQVDHRLFIKFSEIWRSVRTEVPDRIPQRWDVLTPQKHPKEGILLSATRREGLSKQIHNEVLLKPTDMDRFLGELAGHVPMADEAPGTTG